MTEAGSQVGTTSACIPHIPAGSWCSAVAMAAALLWTTNARAQVLVPETSAVETASPEEAATQDAPETSIGSEVVVTGSRLGQSGFRAPTPTTVLGAADLARQGDTTVANVLNQLPAFQGSVTPATRGITSQNGSGTYLDLRGLGTVRTLVLVNGRRHVATNQGAEIDVSLIPQALIQRVEVVTGGASAAYGSDAVAGVVNFILDERLEGVKASVQSGISEEGDNAQRRAALALGSSFAGGRGHVSLSGEIASSEGIRHQFYRDWGRTGYQLIQNPLFAAGNGQPRLIITPNSFQSNRTEGGLILNGPQAERQFLPDGSLAPFVRGNPAGPAFMVGGDGIDQGRYNPLAVPIDRQSVLLLGSFDIAESITAKIEASYGASQSQNNVTQSFNGAAGGYVIPANNAFLTPGTAALLGGQAFNIGRINTDFGFISNDIRIKTYRLVAALEGKFGAGWSWSAYYQYGKTDYDGLLENNVISTNLTRALDAKFSGGQIVCGVNADASATNNDPACAPINVFGFGNPSAAAIDYVTGVSSNIVDIHQDVFSADLQGSLFDLGAGPVAFAIGGEYRREQALGNADDLSQANAFFIGNPKDLFQPGEPGEPASFNVKEAFLEVGLPLLRDSPLGDSLELNGAVRLTDYSTSGSVTTWKVGGTYAPVAGLRFRATRSRDIRAPNINELYTPPRTNFATVFDPTRNGSSVFIPVNTRGNTDLRPEKADTFTAGIVFEPSFIPRLRVSVDYYDIEIGGAINTLTAQQTIDRCAGGQTDLCQFVNRDGGSTITSVDSVFVNLAQFSERGVDIEAVYAVPLGSGTLSARVLATYIDRLVLDDGVVKIDRAGEAGPNNLGINNPGAVPTWRGTATLVYEQGPLGLSLTGRYVDGGKYDNTFVEGVDINDNTVDSRFYLNGSVEMKVLNEGRREITIFGAVNNILDKDPPFAPTQFQNSYVTNQALYDTIGRNFVAGARLSF